MRFLGTLAGLIAAHTPRQRRMLKQERLIATVTNDLYAGMRERGISKAQLARDLGVTRGFVCQVLSGDRNMTLRTLSDLADAMGCDVSIGFPEIGAAEMDVIRDQRYVFKPNPQWSNPPSQEPASLHQPGSAGDRTGALDTSSVDPGWGLLAA